MPEWDIFRWTTGRLQLWEWKKTAEERISEWVKEGWGGRKIGEGRTGLLRLHSPAWTVYGPSRGFALTAKQHHTAISTYCNVVWSRGKGGRNQMKRKKRRVMLCPTLSLQPHKLLLNMTVPCFNMSFYLWRMIETHCYVTNCPVSSVIPVSYTFAGEQCRS